MLNIDVNVIFHGASLTINLKWMEVLGLANRQKFSTEVQTGQHVCEY